MSTTNFQSLVKANYSTTISKVLGITGDVSSRSALMYQPSNTTWNLVFLLDPTTS